MGFCAISFNAIGIPDTDVVGVPLVELHIKQFSLPITAIQSAALSADAKQTEFCAYLSAILLCGLLLKVLFGWWLADPVAALIMVPIIAREE
jgi:divalent metal cation (Fe/Co/Zn/Cd) transporter